VPRTLRAVTATVLGCLAASYLAITHTERKEYASLPSLRLPGATRIHLPESQARDYRWLAQQLTGHCDLFVGFPELPSLHIWTGKAPLPGMDVDDWMLTASDEQQFATTAILAEHPNACAIYNPQLVAFWNRANRNLDLLPVVRYIHQNFKVAGTTGHFSLLVQNDRHLTVVSNP